MKKKNAFAFICGMILIFNQILLPYGTSFAEENNTITLSQDYINLIEVKSKEYDGKVKADVDYSNVDLLGLKNGDDVKLSATAEFSDANAGDKKTVVIKDFFLEGQDAEKYDLKLTDDQKKANVTSSITPRILWIDPDPNCFVMENSPLPEDIKYTVYKTCAIHSDGCIVSGDKVKTDGAKLSIVNVGEEDKKQYKYKLDDVNDTDNLNYVFDIDPEKTPESKAADAMTITEAIVTKENAKILEQHDFGFVADDSVKIKISSTSKDIFNSVVFKLSDGQKAVVNKAEEIKNKSDQKEYRYTAEFIFSLTDEERYKTISDITCVVDNGTASNAQKLYFQTPDNNKTSSCIIIDSKEPEALDIVPKNHSDGQFYDAKGTFVDSESGIKKIRYRWDNDLRTCDWISFDNFSHNPGDKVSFYSMIRWSDPSSFDTRPQRGGAHKIEIEITDNAGKTFTKQYITDGSDTKAPIVTYIRLDKTTDTTWDKVIKILSFGNYVKDELSLSIKVKDVSESDQISGLKKIELTDGKDTDEKIISSQDKISDDEYVYSFALKPQQKIENWYIKLTDNCNCYDYYSVRELLQSDAAKEEIIVETPVSTDEKSESVITDENENMDWYYLKSDKWVFDTIAPNPEPIWGESVFYNEISKTYYYNKHGGKFAISLSDNYSISEWTVTPLYKANQEDKGEILEKHIKKETFSSETSDAKYEVDTSELSTGWYTYSVSAIDHAGNTLSSKVVAEFYVDHENPTGKIEVVSPNTKTLDNESFWIKEKDESGNIQPIKFRMYTETIGASLQSANVQINGDKKEINFTDKQLKLDEDTGKKYLEFEITPDDKNTNDGLTYNNDHTYDISADLLSYSGNDGQASYILHVDTDNPIVEKFVVTRKNSTIDNVLNVLTFGAFSKDALVFTVKVSDNKFDSGVDYVTIKHNELTDAVKMKSKGNGEYYYELSSDKEIFQSEIIVTVYDKTGKNNVSCPDIQNTTGDRKTTNNHFAMIETVSPSLIVDLPITDSIIRNDGQIWYRDHTNSETDSEKIINISVQDENSGIRQVQMFINDQDVTEISKKFELKGTELPTIAATEQNKARITDKLSFQYSVEKIAELIKSNDDGSYVIEFKIVDNAGNVTVSPVNSDGILYENNKITYYRDTINPSVVQFEFNPTTADDIANTSDFIERLEYGYYFKRDFTATVKVDDVNPTSGFDKVVFKLIPYIDGVEQSAEEYVVNITDGNQVSYTVRAGFKGQIYAMVYDKVNNSSEFKTPQAFVSDEHAPTITIDPLPADSNGTDSNGNKLYTGAVQFKVTISDMESGLKSVSYSKNSELNSIDNTTTSVENTDVYSNSMLANGWQITGTDVNLITEVSQVFTFSNDDNDISMTFSAADHSANCSDPVTSETFTIDTIAPQISISNDSALINDMYYREKTAFVITVNERNFDEKLIVSSIENSFGNNKPTVSFQSGSSDSNIHSATVNFGEGDYKFSISGTDRGGHSADITYNGKTSDQYFLTSFNVDATPPSIKTNFDSFGKDDDPAIYFNAKEKAEAMITVVEHNFYSEDMGIVIQRKIPGSSHTDENWENMSVSQQWINAESSDTHSLKILFENDGVYRITMNSKDRAGNKGVFIDGKPDHTAIFEIDRTDPIISSRNGNSVNETEIKFSDIYSFDRRSDTAPSVAFKDTNIEHIKYNLKKYTPEYSNGKEIGQIKPSEEEGNVHEYLSSESTNEMVYTLPDFIADGVYAVELTAYDKAGNASKVTENTYVRMINTDILAYIENSNSDNKTGWYSFEDNNGPISKQPENFSDLDIVIFSKQSESSRVFLVDKDTGEKTDTGITSNENSLFDNKMFDVGAYRYTLPGNYFTEHYTADADTSLYLMVDNAGKTLDLGEMYIDNTKPSCDIPEHFKDWGWFIGSGEHTIVFNNISETLDIDKTVVYINGKEEKPVYDAAKNSLSITLSPGSYSVGLMLVDRAGNSYNIAEIQHLAIGNGRLLIIVFSVLGIVLILFVSIIIAKRIKRIRT